MALTDTVGTEMPEALLRSYELMTLFFDRVLAATAGWRVRFSSAEDEDGTVQLDVARYLRGESPVMDPLPEDAIDLLFVIAKP